MVFSSRLLHCLFNSTMQTNLLCNKEETYQTLDIARIYNMLLLLQKQHSTNLTTQQNKDQQNVSWQRLAALVFLISRHCQLVKKLKIEAKNDLMLRLRVNLQLWEMHRIAELCKQHLKCAGSFLFLQHVPCWVVLSNIAVVSHLISFFPNALYLLSWQKMCLDRWMVPRENN